MEVLVIVAIVTILSSVIITYTSESREQLALQIEKAKVAQVVSRAKSLSVSTYNDPEVPCGYGVHVGQDNQKYVLFSYKMDPCANLKTGVITIGGEGYSVVEEFSLAKPLRFNTGDVSDLDTIFFLPPDPKTLLWREQSPMENGSLRIDSTKESAEIKVNTGGQITF